MCRLSDVLKPKTIAWSILLRRERWYVQGEKKGTRQKMRGRREAIHWEEWDWEPDPVDYHETTELRRPPSFSLFPFRQRSKYSFSGCFWRSIIQFTGTARQKKCVGSEVKCSVVERKSPVAGSWAELNLASWRTMVSPSAIQLHHLKLRHDAYEPWACAKVVIELTVKSLGIRKRARGWRAQWAERESQWRKERTPDDWVWARSVQSTKFNVGS